MRELMDIIKSRRSTRSFIPDKLPPREQIEQLALAAQWAPSGMGKYLWHFSVIYNAQKSLALAQAVAKAANRGPEYNFYHAPVQIIVSYKRDEIHAFLVARLQWKTSCSLPNRSVLVRAGSTSCATAVTPPKSASC